VTSVRTSAKTEVLKDVKQNGDFVVDNITRKIHDAESLDCTTSANQLTVNNTDPVSGLIVPTVYSAVINSGSCRLSANIGGVTNYLTTAKITLANTSDAAICAAAFKTTSCNKVSGKDANVTFEFTLYQTNPASGLTPSYFEKTSQKFTTTVSMRNIN
jgi:hypothetical protein